MSATDPGMEVSILKEMSRNEVEGFYPPAVCGSLLEGKRQEIER